MPYYTDANGALYFLDDAKYAGILPPGCTEISDTAALAIENRTPPLADLQATACIAIDNAALAVDHKYLTCGGQQGQVYQQKLAQAQDYQSKNYPALADPLPTTDPNYALYGYIRAYRTTLRVTNAAATDQNAADQIISQGNQYAISGVQREEIRLTGKAEVSAATTEADVNTAMNNAISQLQAL